jgi:hypothetical protein
MKALILISCLMIFGATAFADLLPPRKNQTLFVTDADAKELNAALTPTSTVKRTLYRRGQVTSHVFRSSTGMLQVVCDVFPTGDDVQCSIQTSDGKAKLPVVYGDD